jgi:5-formyltetrahydrofolate cyclo-ligase
MSDFSGQTKADVRRGLLAARRSRSDPDQVVPATLATLATGLDTVAAYVPMAGEPGGSHLPDSLAAVCGRLLLPIVQPDLDLDWVAYAGSLVPGPFGLREPVGSRLGPDAVASASLVIVPAVAVDRRGVRLGRGGGSYDRALARLGPGALIVAALYDGEFVSALPFDEHDVRVHAVVTPSGLTRL